MLALIDWRRAAILWSLCVLLFARPRAIPAAEPAPVERRDFHNVIAPGGADPWVVREEGWYYATWTTGQNITLLRSRTLSALGAGERQVVWTPPRRGPASQHLWAPELHRIDNAWYVYFAADDGRNENHRMFVLRNRARDPFEGEFTLMGKIGDPRQDRWGIDGTVVHWNDAWYYFWSGWEGTKNDAQHLYVARLKNPWTLATGRVRIASPQFEWERRGGPPAVNEGPQPLVHDGRLHLVYSAAGSWTDHYCLGRLSLTPGGDPLVAANWSKAGEPVFQSTPGVIAPGHCCFVPSLDGSESWLVYHAARFRGAGWNRLLRAQPFGFSSTGLPDFGAPAEANRPIPLPAGEPSRWRFEAEGGGRTGRARLIDHPSCSGGVKVGGLDDEQSRLKLTLRVPAAGRYVLAIRGGNGTAGKQASSHSVTINNDTPRQVRYEWRGWDLWSIAFVSVELREGDNKVEFTPASGYAEIDCVDVIPDPE